MQPTDDSSLLRQYAENNSDEAFAALVTRHINLVYSVALRQVGNPHHAEEITRAVFIILAKKAAALRHDKALSSWLFQAARLTANNFVRSESRRHRREEEAYMKSALDESGAGVWQKIAPLLDDAVAGLREKDRQAIVLRFYEGRNLREVGLALGVNEDAAEKWVGRALEKLRKFFTKRGVSSTTAIIAGTISANSVQAAPVALAKTVTAVAIAKGATASISTLTLIQGALKVMAWSKAKTVIAVGVLLAAGTTTTLVIQQIHNASRPIHVIKVKFVEIQNSPTDFLKSFPSITSATGILNADSAQAFLKMLQSKPGFKTLYEPEVALTYGSVRTMSTTIITIVTNFAFVESNSVSSIFPQTGTVETGPVLNITSTATSNGLTKLAVNASITYFLGYADTSKLSPRYTNNLAGERVDLPIVLPLVQTKKASTEATLEDGQTLVMILPESEQQAFSDTPPSGDALKPVNDKKISIILLTPEFTNTGKNQ